MSIDSIFEVNAVSLADNNGPNLDPVFNELWTWLLKNTKKYVNTKVGKDIISYFIEESFEDCGFDSEDNSIYFGFRDVAGATPVSSAAAHHWFELSFIQLFDELNAIAEFYGFELQKPKKNLQELTARQSEILLFEADGKLHTIYIDDSGKPLELITEVGVASVEDLDPRLKKKVLSLSQSKLCACPMCTKIRAGKLPVTVKQSAHKLPKEAYFEKLSTALRFPHYAKHLRLIKEYDLPDSVSRLTSLKELNMWDCYGQISPEIGNLKNLKILEISGWEGEIPETIGDLKNLEKLEIKTNWRLAKIPESITNLSKLTRLCIGSSKLQEIGTQICDFEHLETLSLSDTSISILPKDVGRLKELRLLYIRDTNIMKLPESIKNCSSLEKIFYDKKQAETIERDLDQYGLSRIRDDIYYS